MANVLLEHEPSDAQHRIRATVDVQLTQDEVDEIGFAIQVAVDRIGRRRATKPHVVHVKPKFEDIPIMVGVIGGGNVQAEDHVTGKPLFEQRQTNRPLHCPDCRSILQGHDVAGVVHLVCPRTDGTIPPCDAGCIVACGITE